MNFLNSLPLTDKQKKKVDKLAKLAKLTGLDKPINDKLKVKPEQHSAGHQQGGYVPPAYQQVPTGYHPHSGPQYPESGSQHGSMMQPTGYPAPGASPGYGIPPSTYPSQQPHGPIDYTQQPYQQPYQQAYTTPAPPTSYPSGSNDPHSSTAPPQYSQYAAPYPAPYHAGAAPGYPGSDRMPPYQYPAEHGVKPGEEHKLDKPHKADKPHKVGKTHKNKHGAGVALAAGLLGGLVVADALD